MLPHFPDPYPDEIFCGILGRYQLRNGYSNYKGTQDELFGSKGAISTIYFPSRLYALCERLPKGSTLDELRFINNNTMLPLFRPFLPTDRRKKVITAMCSNNGQGIYASLGLPAGGVAESNGRLRYCPDCVNEDIGRYGEPYWHRLHQAPGVLVCPVHKVFLEDQCNVCNEPFRFNGRQAIVNPPYKCNQGHNLDFEDRKIDLNDKVHLHLLDYALDVNCLLTTICDDISYFKIIKLYRSLLQKNDLASPNGRIYQRELHDSFKAFYGEQFLQLVKSQAESVDFDWLAVIARKPKKLVHPVRHILFMRFLAGSVERFLTYLNDGYSYKPFGKGPWPCLNPVASHYKQPVVTEVIVTKDFKTKDQVGTFSCSCGFIYSRRGPDSSPDGIYKIGRIKSFGSVWEKKLLSLLERNAYSFRQIAKQMQVDTNTVIRYADMLGYHMHTGTNKLVQNKTVAAIDYKKIYRQKMLSIKKANPLASRTEMRNMAYKEFAWLHRNDREWLDGTLPCPTPVSTRNMNEAKRVDWETRDEEISLLVLRATQEIRLISGKPVRLTLSSIGRYIGKQALLEHYIEKMPKTSEVLNNVTESIEDFQMRRIKWAINELEKNNEEIVEWRIIRRAGLRPGFSDKVSAVIKKEIEHHPSL